MKVVIFGATGIVGSAVTEESLSRGYDVTVFTRDASHVKIQNKNLHVVTGSVLDERAVLNAVKGKDAVINTLGIGGRGNGKPTTFVSRVSRLIMEQMDRAQVKRYIVMSAIGAGDSWNYLPWIYRHFLLPVFQSWFVPIIADKNTIEADVKKSDLDWTIVRPTTVKPGESKGNIVATTTGKGIHFTIRATDLARFIVDQLSDNSFLKQTPTVSN